MSKRYEIKTSLGDLYIRLFENGDEDLLLKFSEMIGPESRRLFSPYHWGTEKQTSEYQEAVLKTKKGIDASFLLLDSRSSPVALLNLWGVTREGGIDNHVLHIPTLGMCVADEFQGKGIGKKCMLFLIDIAKSLNVDGIELTTVTDNDRAVKLYLSAGFRDIGLLNIPLGIDPSTVDESKLAKAPWRKERHMVYFVNPDEEAHIMRYLLHKQTTYANRV